MALLRQLSEPVRAPVRRNLDHYRDIFENLIHAVKNELVERFDRSDAATAELQRVVAAGQSSHSDQLAVSTAATRKLEAVVDDLRGEVSTMRTELPAQLSPSFRMGQLVGSRLADIDEHSAAFLNWTSSWNGPLADAGLFINHPFLVEWKAGGAFVRLVNERIIEQPFVFGAIAGLPVGSRVLDIGGGESTLALALASLGYDTTVIEPRGYPFEHPNLTVYGGPLEEFEAAEPFDAVVLLSTIEHLGIGHYADGTEENAAADLEAMRITAGLTAPNGKLVLTTPYGPSDVTELERIYDRADLERLLDGWEIERASVGRKVDETTWTIEADELVDHRGDTCVAMIIATPAATKTSE